MSSIRDQLLKHRRCVHFTGSQHERCAAGVVYESVRLTHEPMPIRHDGARWRVSIPCLESQNPAGATCASLQMESDAEIDATAAEFERITAAVDAGRSPCCDAPLDERQVVRNVAGKGTGPRFCSKCEKLVDRLCSFDDDHVFHAHSADDDDDDDADLELN